MVVLDEAMQQVQKRMLEVSAEVQEKIPLDNDDINDKINDNTKSRSRMTGGSPPRRFKNPGETITGQRPSITPLQSSTRDADKDLLATTTNRTGPSVHISHVAHDQSPPPPQTTSSDKEKREKLWARVVQLRDELYAVLADDEACDVKFPQMMTALEAAEAAGAVETVYFCGSRRSVFGG